MSNDTLTAAEKLADIKKTYHVYGVSAALFNDLLTLAANLLAERDAALNRIEAVERYVAKFPKAEWWFIRELRSLLADDAANDAKGGSR